VLAIGSPFRLTHSVSHGIISALGRTDVQVEIDYQNWIQTDASINPGNSGGPLINMRGEVIGMSVAIATDSGVSQGVAFAIPSNTLRRVAELLKRGEPIVRGYLGVVIRPVDPSMADAYDLEAPEGVFIEGVGRDTPGEAGGLLAEDIIVAIDGKPIQTREQLQETIAHTPPDSKLEMTVWREGARRTLAVTIGTQPEGFRTTGTLSTVDPAPDSAQSVDQDVAQAEQPRESAEPASAASQDVEFKDLGLSVTTLTPDSAPRSRGSGGPQHGALVTRVRPASEAYLASLGRGQVIVEANGEQVREAADLERILTADALAKGVRLKVLRGSRASYTVLQVR
jgi:serine protease Do